MQALERLGRTMTNAHKKDYERKRGSEDDADGSSSDEEEEGEEEEGGLESADFYQRTAEGEAGELTLTKTVTEAGRWGSGFWWIPFVMFTYVFTKYMVRNDMHSPLADFFLFEFSVH